MASVYEDHVSNARKVERSLLQGNATLCIPPFGRACKGIWPVKTAEHLAAVSGQSVRTASYQISGEVEPSGVAVAALVVEVTKRKRE